MVKQKMGGREELAGRDVILVHRLLKNTVSEKFSSRAYALYSDACIQTMGMVPLAQGLIEHRETIDIIGDVKLWLRDLDEAWKKENERAHVEVAVSSLSGSDRIVQGFSWKRSRKSRKRASYRTARAWLWRGEYLVPGTPIPVERCNAPVCSSTVLRTSSGTPSAARGWNAVSKLPANRSRRFAWSYGRKLVTA
jgi:hypothetical protein